MPQDYTGRTIHHALATSYLVFLMASLVGLLVGTLFATARFSLPHARAIGLICFAVGPLLILWAQVTSGAAMPQATNGYFSRGPYRALRNPTQIGLLLLVIGYAVISRSAIFLGLALIGYLVSNIFFMKYERMLAAQYPDEYRSYRARTPKI